jgi:uncharacterized protein involved in response to NO
MRLTLFEAMVQSAPMTKPGGRPRVPEPSTLTLFSYGFRPFFLGAAIWAIVALALWIAAFAGLWQLAPGYGALAWHAHEMLFGYGSAVVAGFLLTAVPNWTGRLPVAGWRLVLLFVLWGLARLSFLAIGTLGPLPGIIIDSAFLPCLLIVMAREVVIGRNWRNLAPLAIVAVLAVANITFHAEVLVTGAPSTGFRAGVAALVALITLIGGRITPSFTHNWLFRAGSPVLPAPFGAVDKAALVISGAALLAWVAAPTLMLTALLFFAAAAVLTVRLWRWEGRRTWREPLVLVLHLGYAFVPIGFLLGAVAILSPQSLVGTAPLHAWTVGAIGLMTLGVMTRATRGHTGRALLASPATVASYGAMVTAALLRMAAGLFPQASMDLLEFSGLAWIAAFALFLAEYTPMLIKPRLGCDRSARTERATGARLSASSEPKS